MKPETKRRFAIEWLILLASAVVGVVAILWDKVPYQLEKYWKSDSDPIWFHDVSSREWANYTPKPPSTTPPKIDELFYALQKADDAGEAVVAKMFADWIRELQSKSTGDLQPTAEPSPPVGHELKENRVPQLGAGGAHDRSSEFTVTARGKKYDVTAPNAEDAAKAVAEMLKSQSSTNAVDEKYTSPDGVKIRTGK